MFDFIRYKQNFLNATQGWDNEKWSNFNDNPFLISSPILQNCHVKNCRLVESRAKMLEYLPKDSVVAEVGTQYGLFAEKILSIVKPKKLHLIDYNFDLFKAEVSQQQKIIFQEGIENGTIELHEGDSSTILASFPEEYFDWIYIDADHAYEGVYKDIYEAYTKVKSDGMLVFNDYTNWSVCEIIPYGVAKAVNEFCIANNWEVVFLALQFLGYHDIAIKKNIGEKEVRVQLQECQSHLERSQLQIQQLGLELEQAKRAIDFMENDKFWKLRSQWLKIKQIFS
ncbi:class I SAM-dependent methyltransferase [filamentous cyanobacterium Phorm 46]|nr:class I SAM-dependent methyltransferase [filamentous cyanobacterium Phorm 46]PSB50320.1 class I SAM-dependent methyltransferase [filamentous cyanobacterium Phorm 6]